MWEACPIEAVGSGIVKGDEECVGVPEELIIDPMEKLEGVAGQAKIKEFRQI